MGNVKSTAGGKPDWDRLWRGYGKLHTSAGITNKLSNLNTCSPPLSLQLCDGQGENNSAEYCRLPWLVSDLNRTHIN